MIFEETDDLETLSRMYDSRSVESWQSIKRAAVAPFKREIESLKGKIERRRVQLASLEKSVSVEIARLHHYERANEYLRSLPLRKLELENQCDGLKEHRERLRDEVNGLFAEIKRLKKIKKTVLAATVKPWVVA